MSQTSAETAGFHVGTASMVFNLILCTIFTIITILGQKHHQKRLMCRSSITNKPSSQRIVYFLYACVAMCTVECFLCHYTILWTQYKPIQQLFCRWAAPICLVMFFTAKACLYGFFLERAKVSQGLL
eukprot:217174_1